MLAAIGPSAYWYMTRSTGWVALLLLSLTMVLGVLDVNRWSTVRWPRFVLDSLHRTVSLLVLAFLGVHVLTAVLDSFAPIGVVDVVLPFVGRYRPLWLGLGALALDLLVALAITSVMRQRVGHRAWRTIHWLAYACWPIALVHALGTGSDVKGGWGLALAAVCVLAVIAAACVRALHGWPVRREIRGGALALSLLAPIGLVVWLASGPLAADWARRAGTPQSLLGAAAPAVASATRVAGASPGSSATLNGPFRASLSGTIAEGRGTSPGLIAVKIDASLAGAVAGRLEIEIEGPPVGEGGVSLRRSSVTLGSPPSSVVYHGRIAALNGNRVLARVRSASGRALTLQVALNVDPAARTVTGTVAASPA